MRVHDKKVLITGGRRGIGLSVATRLAAEGAVVLLADIEKTAKALSDVGDLAALGSALQNAADAARRARQWLLDRGETLQHFIGGAWCEPESGDYFDTRNPATGERLARVADGNEADVNRAVAYAQAELAAVGVSVPLQAGSAEGERADGYRWERAIALYPTDESETSARVGIGFSIMDSIIWVAVITILFLARVFSISVF